VQQEGAQGLALDVGGGGVPVAHAAGLNLGGDVLDALLVQGVRRDVRAEDGFAEDV
jgi:hypothetical protein